MKIKNIPTAKQKITSILQIICTQNIVSNRNILDEDNSIEISRVLANYISNTKYSRQKYTMPPESEIENMELRQGWGKFDSLSDIDLWVDGQQSDLTAIFRIKTKTEKDECVVLLYDIKVL